jgi:hypothetical protein
VNSRAANDDLFHVSLSKTVTDKPGTVKLGRDLSLTETAKLFKNVNPLAFPGKGTLRHPDKLSKDPAIDT